MLRLQSFLRGTFWTYNCELEKYWKKTRFTLVSLGSNWWDGISCGLHSKILHLIRQSLLDYLIQASLIHPAHGCLMIFFKEMMMMIISSDNTFHSLSALRSKLSWSVFILNFQKYFSTSWNDFMTNQVSFSYFLLNDKISCSHFVFGRNNIPRDSPTVASEASACEDFQAFNQPPVITCN